MSSTKKELNGSVQLFAQAINQLFEESQKPTLQLLEKLSDEMRTEMGSIKSEMGSMKSDIKSIKVDIAKLNADLKTTNENMSMQFSQQGQLIADVVDKKLERFAAESKV